MKKQVIIDETVGDLEEPTTSEELSAQRQNQFKSKRGAKLLGPKAKGVLRTLVDAPIRTNRPKNVYKERIVDYEDESSEATWCLWYMTEQSEYIGKEEIVKFNPRTEEELPVGFDYTMPFTVAKAKELIKKSFGGSMFYVKDGEDTYSIRGNDLEKMFLEDYLPGDHRTAMPVPN